MGRVMLAAVALCLVVSCAPEPEGRIVRLTRHEVPMHSGSTGPPKELLFGLVQVGDQAQVRLSGATPVSLSGKDGSAPIADGRSIVTGSSFHFRGYVVASRLNSACGFIDHSAEVHIDFKLPGGKRVRLSGTIVQKPAITNHTGDKLSDEYNAVWAKNGGQR